MSRALSGPLNECGQQTESGWTDKESETNRNEAAFIKWEENQNRWLARWMRAAFAEREMNSLVLSFCLDEKKERVEGKTCCCLSEAKEGDQVRVVSSCWNDNGRIDISGGGCCKRGLGRVKMMSQSIVVEL